MIIGVDGFAWQLVSEAEAGIHIEPENAEELTEVLLKLRANPDECRKMGENALNRLAAHHNRDAQAAAYLDILEDIVNANIERKK
jgi:glycosyltransferase involved in cell wall biosynthesis